MELSQLVPQKELDSSNYDFYNNVNIISSLRIQIIFILIVLEADNMELCFSKDGFKSKDEELNILRRQVEVCEFIIVPYIYFGEILKYLCL